MPRLLTILLLVMSCVRPVLAWNDTGHMTVAMIAWRQLSDGERQKVWEILKAHPHYQLYLAAEMPERVSEDEWTFLRASIWSDFVRPTSPGIAGELFKGPEITRFHRGEWHVVVYPWVPPAERKTINPSTLPVQPEPNAITGFEESIKQLQSQDATPEEKGVALTWVSHLVGDLHQPLHACTMFSSQYPQGDREGSAQAIRANGVVLRLHQFWDMALGTSDAYDALIYHADQILSQPRHERQNLPQLAANKSFESWVNESHQLAIAMAHLNGRLQTVPMLRFEQKQITADDIPSLPPSYLVNAHQVAERRIALAGYRLAEQIKRVLPK